MHRLVSREFTAEQLLHDYAVLASSCPVVGDDEIPVWRHPAASACSCLRLDWPHVALQTNASAVHSAHAFRAGFALATFNGADTADVLLRSVHVLSMALPPEMHGAQ